MIRIIEPVYVILLLAVVRPSDQVLYSCNSKVACGCSPNSASVSRIVGGEVAGIGTWGWIVSLEITVDDIYICGGSILSSSWIITAAHCMYNSKNPLINVYAGSNNRWSGLQNRTVSQIIIHPEYDETTFDNDIALLKLSNPLNMNGSNVAPICMPIVSPTILASTEWPPANTTATIGWGLLTEDGILSDNLRQVTLQTIDYQTFACSRGVHNKQVQLCAGVSDGTKDTCQGDSGGPLMMFTPSNQWVLVGLTSAGEFCARMNYSGIYTRVAAFKDWIESHTNESHWIVTDSHANTMSTLIHRLFFFLTPVIFLRTFFQ